MGSGRVRGAEEGGCYSGTVRTNGSMSIRWWILWISPRCHFDEQVEPVPMRCTKITRLGSKEAPGRKSSHSGLRPENGSDVSDRYSIGCLLRSSYLTYSFTANTVNNCIMDFRIEHSLVGFSLNHLQCSSDSNSGPIRAMVMC